METTGAAHSVGPDTSVGKRGRAWRLISVAALGAFLWRVAAFLSPSSLFTTPDDLRLHYGLLGLWYLLFGVVAAGIRPDRFSRVFFVMCLGSAVHWGGGIGGMSNAPEMSLLFIYLGFSAMAEGALLHLALIYPGGRDLPKWVLGSIYAPAGFSVVVAPVAVLLPVGGVSGVVGVVLLLANLLSFGAAAAFVASLFQVPRPTRAAAQLPLIIAVLFGSGLASIAGSAGLFGGRPEAWNLVLGLIPACFATVLVFARSSGPPVLR